MHQIRRHAPLVVVTAVSLIVAGGIALGVTLTPGAAAPVRPAPQFLQRWQVNSAVLDAGGQYPPNLDLTKGGLVHLTCTAQTCNNPNGAVDWNLGGPVVVPAGQELIIDHLSFYYLGSGVIAGAGSGSGPGGPAGGLMWLTIAVPDQTGNPNAAAGADILLPLQAVNLPAIGNDPQLAVTGSEQGSWVVLPGDHILLAGRQMGTFGGPMDAAQLSVRFVSIFGHYARIG